MGGGQKRSLWALVIDDDRDLRESVCDTLADAGYRVSTAADGKEALAIMLVARPDLIILDLRMPKKSGWDVLEAMRKSVTLLDVPVIVLSADLSMPPSGGSAWLKKPVAPQQLLRTVERVLR
jgi:DNA-binding response OmpR family regulator